MPTVRTVSGLDRLIAGDVGAAVRSLAAGRLGFLTNDAAVSGRFRHGRTELLDAGRRVVRLFSPEHGLTAHGTDGAGQADVRDPLTGLPCTSLYGERFRPGAADFDGLALFVDASADGLVGPGQQFVGPRP